MSFLISHRYPVLSAVLSAISNAVFLALGQHPARFAAALRDLLASTARFPGPAQRVR